MSAVAAVAVPATAGSSGLPARRLRVAPVTLVAAACYLPAPYLSFTSRTIDPRIAEFWPLVGVGFVLLTTVWSRPWQAFAGALTYLLAVSTATSLLLGDHLAANLWAGVVAVAQSALAAALYRAAHGGGDWVPRSPRDLAAMLAAVLGTSFLAGEIGGYPGISALSAPTWLLLWWCLRNGVFVFIAIATFSILFHSGREETLPRSPLPNTVGVVVAALGCVDLVYVDPHLPLSWLLMVPAVWAGMTLTLRGTAWLNLTVALASAVMTALPHEHFGYDGRFPASTIVDTLLMASTTFSLLLTLMRAQRGRLIDELDQRRRESVNRQRLLETVFDAMRDGLMIVDEDGVSSYNTAARTQLGRPILRGAGRDWATAFGVRHTDGGPMSDEDVRSAFALDPEQPSGRQLELVVNAGEADAKVLDVSVLPLPGEDGLRRIVLMQDVTAQRARLRELTNFAGTVAHDLRGPLTVLEGWLEVLDDDALLGRVADHDTLTKATSASRRMRSVIEDWLGYTVTQNGKLQLTTVKLLDAVDDVVAGRLAGHAQIGTDLSHAVVADPALLRQLLDNLLGNAVKYTPADEIPRIEVVSRRDDEPGWVRVDVVDQGMGIPDGHEEDIFEEFYRGAEGRSAGTGLGLALARRIVARHGGEMTARRNAGGGSTFTFTLPEAV